MKGIAAGVFASAVLLIATTAWSIDVPVTRAASPPFTTTTGAHTEKRIVIDHDTVITSALVLRPGDTVELRNGATLSFGPGGSADWQGTPTPTWSKDGYTQNLTRDIKIFGSGDIRFEHGSGPSLIRFVEVNLRPAQELGHYPLHWHHAGDGSRGTLVEGVVVRNSTNRAFVPHGSHGITFKDTIASNIIGEAYWWDPSPRGESSDDSNDLAFIHALADGVHPFPETAPVAVEPHGRHTAFDLGGGTGNTIRQSVAMNVHAAGTTDCSGFLWPAHASSEWVFEDNSSHSGDCWGILVWQNDPLLERSHVIDGFRSWNQQLGCIRHGAYVNTFEYRRIECHGQAVEARAAGWFMTGGSVGTVVAASVTPEPQPTAVFTDVIVETILVRNAPADYPPRGLPAAYVFTNCACTFDDVVVESVVPGTSITIDGETRTFWPTAPPTGPFRRGR